LREAAIASSCLTVCICPSVRMEQLGSHSTDFHDIWYLSISRKSVKKVQVPLKYDMKSGYFTLRPIYIFLSCLAQFFLHWKIFHTEIVENIKTYILCSITFLFQKSCRLWDNVENNIVQPSGPQMTIWRTRTACWICGATNTYSEYVIVIAFPLQQWLHKRALVLRYTYSARLVLNGWRTSLRQALTLSSPVMPFGIILLIPFFICYNFGLTLSSAKNCSIWRTELKVWCHIASLGWKGLNYCGVNELRQTKISALPVG
jgi:hypothetical protein